ncbi:hypothetical protein YC2023_043073 [Brassica napus]
MPVVGHYSWHSLTLFNYKGKLGIQYKENPCRDRLVLWVLEDAEYHKWSKHIYVFSPLDKELVKCTEFVGMTGTGEVVYFSYSYHPVNRYHVLFYNIERKTFTRINIVKRLSVVPEELLRTRVTTAIVSEETSTTTGDNSFSVCDNLLAFKLSFIS